MLMFKLLTDEAILEKLGTRLANIRIDHDLTQANLAREAGVSKRTVERVESGGSAQMSNIIRILRELDLLEGLDRLIPEARPRPMDLLKRKGKIRKRVRTKRTISGPATPWSWDEQG